MSLVLERQAVPPPLLIRPSPMRLRNLLQPTGQKRALFRAPDRIVVVPRGDTTF